MRILVDMDEVIADFRSAAIRLHGRNPEEIALRNIELETWDLTAPLGISHEEFWRPIDEAGEAFWEGLEKLPWANDLIELLNSITEEWYIVTSPSQHPSCYSGKAKWLQREFGPRFSHWFPCTHKQLLAHNSVLIDDREANIRKFQEAGGLGILFPSSGNYLHAMRDSPLYYVEKHLTQLFFLRYGRSNKELV